MAVAATAREWGNVAILASAQALFLIASITVMTLSGVVGQDLAAREALATLPVAAMMVGTVSATLPASLFMKRFGRRPGFLLGIAVGGFLGGTVSALGAAAGSFVVFTLGNLLLGAYQSFAMYYRFAAADVAGESRRSLAISLVLAGGVVAAFLGPWNAEYSAQLLPGAGQAGPYAMIAGLSVLAGLLMSLLRVPAASEPDPSAAQRPLKAIVRQPATGVAIACAAVAYAVMTLVMTATPLAVRAAGFGMGEAAFIMQWHVLGMFAPSFVTGLLIRRFGLGRVLLAGAGLLAACSLIALGGRSLAHFWAALVCLGVGWNFLFVGGSSLLTQTHSPAERGKVQGLNDLLVFSLVALGALLAGALLHSVGWATLNLLMLVPVGAVALAIVWLRWRSGTPALVAAG